MPLIWIPHPCFTVLEHPDHETGNRIRQVHVACERPLRLDRVHCGSKVGEKIFDLNMGIRLNCQHLGEIVGKRTPYTTAIDMLDMARPAVILLRPAGILVIWECVG
jgi:hypothetical protein